jgi:ubiquitin C-terminal hydrolase
MNTCLQCLISIPEFNSYFMMKKYKSERVSKKPLDACDAMYDFVNSYSNCNNSSFRAPKSIYNICHSFLPKNQQHDSHVTIIYYNKF